MNRTNKDTKSPTTQTDKTVCKLGLDVHAQSITAARQLDGLNPQPPQTFPVEKFLQRVQEQMAKGHRVISCYEAGPTGYWLHRKLSALGVTNYVVCPTKLDSRGKGVNTDKTDALELLVRLDRYVAGNTRSFSLVRVPTPEQEQKRALTRQREQLRRHRLSLAAQGRLLLLGQGYRQSNSWWKSQRWEKLKATLPAWLDSQLQRFIRLIQALDKETRQLGRDIEQAAPSGLPVGLGKLTHQVLSAEMKDWNHFGNRRQVGSYAGLTGGVSASGQQSADLSITKAGNRRLSTALVECAWRLVHYQPTYWLVKKWAPVLLNPKAHSRRRKQAIIAFARQLLIDLWKWKSGRATPESLGWIMAAD
jgi:transposase